MRPVEALCQVVRAFPDAAGAAAEPAQEIADLEIETILADLAIAEQRVARLERAHSNPRELEQARAWYEDPEYGPMIELRQRHCELDFLLVEGLVTS